MDWVPLNTFNDTQSQENGIKNNLQMGNGNNGCPYPSEADGRGITRISVFKFLNFMIILHYFSLKILISPVYYFWHLLS